MHSIKKQHRTCHFCNSEEGKPRPVGNFIVELKVVDVLGTKKLACQSCHRKTLRILNNENPTTMKPTLYNRLQKIGIRFASLFIMLIFNTAMLFAQGPPGLPGFPDNPDPAPIDGGLSLLAAAGGAYALKKLRDKRNGEEELE